MESNAIDGRAKAEGLRFALAVAAAALLLSRPDAAALGALNAMLCWATAVAPAMFPFMALLPALTGSAASRAYARLLGRPVELLYRLPGGAAPALAAGMLGGSPAGALAARRTEGLDRGQLRRLSLSACGMSPAFLLGGVGSGMLNSEAAGHVLLRAQLATQLLLPLLLRGAWRRDVGPVRGMPSRAAEQPVRAAVGAVLGVCGWMTLFGAAGQAARSLVGDALAVPLLCLADVTAGCQCAAQVDASLSARVLLCAALCGFGGGCIAVQNLSILREAGVRAWEYLAVRALAAALMALLSWAQLAWDRTPALRLPLPPLQLACLCAVALALPALFLDRTITPGKTRN